MTEYSGLTAGLDIGDKMSEICLLDEQGEVIERKRIASTAQSLTKYFSQFDAIRIALESGFHSPWMSRLLEDLGHQAVVANSRRVALIAKNGKKSDKVDAELLARLARSDLVLLSPIQHRSEEHQKEIAVVRARDALVRSRTLMVNHVRGVVKSSGQRLPSTSTSRFHKLEDQLPDALRPALSPLMSSIKEVNERIAELDKEIESLCAKYSACEIFRSIPGVGPVTALFFLLCIEDPHRFKRNRNVGAYLGMTPRKHQSGDDDPELRITRMGNTYLRRLLVNAAHYVLGPFGPDSELRRFGLKLAARGRKRAKKKASVAVARKLAVLMNALWKTGELFEAFPSKQRGSCNSLEQGIDSSAGARDGRDISKGVASAHPAPDRQAIALVER